MTVIAQVAFSSIPEYCEIEEMGVKWKNRMENLTKLPKQNPFKR